ncbi:hypothetical protein BBF96_07830 [Anoxybacter fermentans]|uniref:Uncharacterized protein n=1 Tax=Anoxybacter fermentans TaxID=1323375 RepID=A0A3Q9HQL2_9FIRM|nr:P-loop NTPase [Anoxybacter fermentans]AZR73301.1 hypothetical protein BBF96_07830 [Anoxybacter fermentans]
MSLNLLLEHEDDPVIWRGPLMRQAVRQFWSEVIWNKLDYFILDLPPGTGDVPLTVMQSIPINGLILVSTPQDLVYMEVKKSLKMANILQIPVLGSIENMSYLICPECRKKLIYLARVVGNRLPEKLTFLF